MFCEFRSKEKYNMKLHIRGHYEEKKILSDGLKQFKCTFCDFRSHSEKNIKQHLRSHTEQPKLKCPHCEFRTRLSYTLKQHSWIHSGNPPYKCDQCNYYSYRPKNLDAHVNKVHNLTKPYTCETCSYKATSKDLLIKHVNRCSGEKIITETKTIIEPSDASRNVDTVIEQKEDNKTSPSLQYIIVNVKPFTTCKLCDLTFDLETDLNQHILAEHCNLDEEDPTPCDNEKNTEHSIENIKEKTERTMTLSEEHTNDEIQSEQKTMIVIDNDSVEFEYKCLKLCGACEFHSYDIMELQRHIFKMHAESLKCDQCEFVCQSVKQLVKHSREVHLVNYFACKLCNYICSSREQYDHHVVTKCIDGNHYKCQRCDFQTKYKRTLVEHSFTHDNLNPYKCGFCEFRSNRASNLIRHQYVHNKTKPLKCPECPYNTAQKTCLRRHIQNKH